MEPRSQNLFLFIEDYETENIIDSKLVKLYVNRCVIEEDGFFEICGVYELQFVEDRMFSLKNRLYRESDKQRAKKEDFDRKIFIRTLLQAEALLQDGANYSDNHFVIGSSFYRKSYDFYLNSTGIPSALDRPEVLANWLLDSMIVLGIKSIYVTLLSGHRYNLITENMHKCTYAGHTSAGHTYAPPFTAKKVRPNPRSCFTRMVTKCYDMSVGNMFFYNFSVNDDFELAIKLIRHGRRLNQNILLYLHQKLNSHQMKLKEEKNESFLDSFTGHRFNLSDAYRHDGEYIIIPAKGKEEFLAELEEDIKKSDMVTDDPYLIYLNCICLRYSFYLDLS